MDFQTAPSIQQLFDSVSFSPCSYPSPPNPYTCIFHVGHYFGPCSPQQGWGKGALGSKQRPPETGEFNLRMARTPASKWGHIQSHPSCLRGARSLASITLKGATVAAFCCLPLLPLSSFLSLENSFFSLSLFFFPHLKLSKEARGKSQELVFVFYRLSSLI